MDMNFEQTLSISQYYYLKAYGFAACHVAPSSSGTIPDAHICC